MGLFSGMHAADTFGRVELEHAVTASNLFKYCEPCHGLVLFKHHHPLRFGLPQLADLLLAAEGWFERAAAAHPSARHPFLLWNCGARAGASQFHGHAQVALSQVSTFRHHTCTSCMSIPCTLGLSAHETTGQGCKHGSRHRRQHEQCRHVACAPSRRGG